MKSSLYVRDYDVWRIYSFFVTVRLRLNNTLATIFLTKSTSIWWKFHLMLNEFGYVDELKRKGLCLDSCLISKNTRLKWYNSNYKLFSNHYPESSSPPMKVIKLD